MHRRDMLGELERANEALFNRVGDLQRERDDALAKLRILRAALSDVTGRVWSFSEGVAEDRPLWFHLRNGTVRATSLRLKDVMKARRMLYEAADG